MVSISLHEGTHVGHVAGFVREQPIFVHDHYAHTVVDGQHGRVRRVVTAIGQELVVGLCLVPTKRSGAWCGDHCHPRHEMPAALRAHGCRAMGGVEFAYVPERGRG